MKRKHSFPPPVRLLAGALAGLLIHTPSFAINLTTEEFAPLNFSEDGGQTISGSSSDLMREVLRRTGIEGEFFMLPWRNAYKMALDDKDTCVYSTLRTEEREKLFQWVGPLATSRWVFYSRPGASISARTVDDLRPYVIGTYQGDARATFLKEHDFKVDEANAEEQNLKKLTAGRIDIWLATSNSGPWLARKYNTPIKPILSIYKAESYAACNLSMPTIQIERMNAALRVMFADGTVERLIKPYGIPMPPSP